MDLGTLIAKVNQNSAQGAEILSGLRSSYGSAISATGEAKEAALRMGENAAIITKQEGQGLLEAQNQARRMATANGTNLSSETEILTILGAQQRLKALEVSNRTERVEKIAENSSLANPLGLIYDIFYGDNERAALEASKDSLNSITQSIQGLNQATQVTAQTQKQIAATMSDATVNAAVQLELDKAAQQAAEYRVKMASLNSDLLGKINQFNNQELNNAFKIWGAIESNEQREFNRAMRIQAMEEKAAKEGTDAALLEYYEAGRKALGLPPAANLKEFTALRQVSSERTQAALIKGAEILLTGKLSFGDTPIEALNLKQQFPINIPPVQQPVFDTLEQWAGEFASNPVAAMADVKMAANNAEAMKLWAEAKKPSDKAALTNQFLTAKLRLEADNLDLNNPSGLLALPPIDSLVGSRILDENKFLSTYVKPDVVSGGGIAFNPGKYIQMASEAIAKGEISTSEAAEGLALMSKDLFLRGPGSKSLTSAFGLPEIKRYNVPVVTKSDGLIAPGGVRSLLPGGSLNASRQFSDKINILDEAQWNKYLADYARRTISTGALRSLSVF
jgi:hypothetical protein